MVTKRNHYGQPEPDDDPLDDEEGTDLVELEQVSDTSHARIAYMAVIGAMLVTHLNLFQEQEAPSQIFQIVREGLERNRTVGWANAVECFRAVYNNIDTPDAQEFAQASVFCVP